VSTAPQLSVVIATHNRSQLLTRCLRALEAQDAAADSFEVVVADDGSSDGTAAMMEALPTPFSLRVLSLDKAGKSEALNAGIRAAAGSVCLCIDDDIVAAPELVSEHLAAHLRDPMTVGLGKLIQQPPDGNDWYAEAFARSWNDHYARLAEKEPSWTDCYGGNVSASRELLLEIGGFEAKFPIGEDYEIGFRLRENGGMLTYLPRAVGVHDDQKPSRKLLRDARRQGVSYVGLVKRHPAMMPKLFGWFSEPTLREVLLRRLLLTFRLPPRVLAAPGRLLPGEGRKQIWFCFVSRYAYWRGVREEVGREKWLRITRRVPILMYHGFGADGEEASRFVIPRRSFARQMRALALLRYRPITFEELARRLRECRLPPRRALVITIDDGYRDNLEVAHPVLSRHGFPATLFLVSRKLGVGNDWDGEPPLGERPTLSANQACELRPSGHELGAHTRNHCSLPDVDDATQREEIEGCKRELEAALGVPVTTFAYPYGRRDERAIAAIEAAGFLGACTTHPDLVRFDEDPLRLPRLEIRGTDSLRTFLRKLWLGGP
jgi:peptidoglycan/xylan/chitin deacetylase (PgdA/CDA1 family)/GT2 family glycosyltransferase